MRPPTEPPRRPSAQTPAYQPTLQGSVHTHPTMQMPQVRVSNTPLGPQPQTVQRGETMHMPSHPNNAQLSPGPYSNYPLQSPTASYSSSQHGSGKSGVALMVPCLQRNRACVPYSKYIHTLSGDWCGLSREWLGRRAIPGRPTHFGNARWRNGLKGTTKRLRFWGHGLGQED